MLKPSITVERYPYDDHCLHLQFDATNGLVNFPQKIGDEYKYELGSSEPEDNWAYHFMLRAFTTDRSGHCAIQIKMDNNARSAPYEHASTFSIVAEPAAINRLGNLFLRCAKLEHRRFTWTETDESMD
jgi:hypothetical protein